MANLYSSTICLIGGQELVSGNTNPGEVWLIEEIGTGQKTCVTIVEQISTGTTTYSAITQYASCKECYDDNDFGFDITYCSGGRGTIPIPDNYEDIIFEKIYRTELDNELSCVSIDGVGEGVDITGVTVLIMYETCDECTIQLPRSANTENTICAIICNPTGGTEAVIVNPPHPIWTDGNGAEITQLNAITLGGMYGLNS